VISTKPEARISMVFQRFDRMLFHEPTSALDVEMVGEEPELMRGPATAGRRW
jgi:ABC-type histidine transport system ATPase subunit